MSTKPKTITSTFRLRVVRPLDGDWEKLRATLRSIRAPLHRVLNEVVRELELNGEGPHWAPTDADIEHERAKCHPRTASYRVAVSSWDREIAEANARLERGKTFRGDDDIARLKPSSAVRLGAAGAAFSRWNKYQKDKWKGLTSLPSFKGGSPIYVSSSSGAIGLRAEDGRVVMGLRLLSGAPRVDLIVQPCDGSGFARMKHLLDGSAKIGDVKLIEDEDRRLGNRQWFAFLSVTMPETEKREGRFVAVHRGMRNFLTMAIARSDPNARDAFTAVLETGEDIIRHKAAYTARRRSLGRQGRQLGRGACGHGVDRRHERITRIEDSESRWVRTKCQETAAHLFRKMDRMGATKILIEDWGNPVSDDTGQSNLSEHVEYLVRSFPFAQLRETIEWGAKKRGYEVTIVRTNGMARECPSCGHVNDEKAIERFRCKGCELERDADIVLAWNMLQRNGKEPGIEEHNAAAKRVGDKLRAPVRSRKRKPPLATDIELDSP